MARRSLRAVVTYVVLAGVVVGWGWLLTHPWHGAVEGPDDDVSRWFAGQRTSWLDPVADVGTLLGETVVGLAVGAVVAVVAGLVLRSVVPAVLLLAADAGDGGIYWLGSHADPRDRPPVHILDAGLVPDHSFPSGHTGTAVAVYCGTAVLLAVWLRGRRTSGLGPGGVLVALLCFVPLFVAVSRLYQGAHHLTDVGTSLVYGGIWLAAVVAAVRPRDLVRRTAVPRSTGALRDAPLPHR